MLVVSGYSSAESCSICNISRSYRLHPKLSVIIKISTYIVRVQYFVRGGFVGYRSRVSSKHLSSSSGRRARFLGGQKGLRCKCKMHVWVSDPTKDAD
ncbi:hypothetical protein TNCV_3797891 [Trichonephila clavipes]|nr:hypothetical protein TNCV_3797891 [Trichonephila clavipes]